jgi:N-(2-amino-2-carboxyethyl)-L-glutamate synthase
MKTGASQFGEGVLSTIGNTPLVRLTHIFKDCDFKVFAKLEAFNPGGSVKDRAAYCIIRNALAKGEIEPGSCVIESSSGNMGIGLAQVCSFLGLRFICVVDPKTTSQNIKILEAYGAEVDLVSKPDPMTGEFLPERIARVRTLLRTIQNSYWPNQYANIYNAIAHHETMKEIVLALNGQVDYLFCSTSTCGTLRGCAEYIRDRNLQTKIVAVDAIGSVIFGDWPGKRLIPGHGAGVLPDLYQPGLAHVCVHLSDLDCIVGCRRLLREEAIMAGGSSGAVLMAILGSQHIINSGASCAAIFPDRGERYLDTVYSDDWVDQHFGSVSNLWLNRPVEEQQYALGAASQPAAGTAPAELKPGVSPNAECKQGKAKSDSPLARKKAAFEL